MSFKFVLTRLLLQIFPFIVFLKSHIPKSCVLEGLFKCFEKLIIQSLLFCLELKYISLREYILCVHNLASFVFLWFLYSLSDHTYCQEVVFYWLFIFLLFLFDHMFQGPLLVLFGILNRYRFCDVISIILVFVVSIVGSSPTIIA